MRQLIDLCSRSILRRLELAPSASATADSRLPQDAPSTAAASPAPGAATWLVLAARRWFQRRVARSLAGRIPAAGGVSPVQDERPVPTRYY